MVGPGFGRALFQGISIFKWAVNCAWFGERLRDAFRPYPLHWISIWSELSSGGIAVPPRGNIYCFFGTMCSWPQGSCREELSEYQYNHGFINSQMLIEVSLIWGGSYKAGDGPKPGKGSR